MQNRYDKCPNCMQALGQGEDVCPYCGFDVSGYEEKPNCLRPFTVLQGKYMIGRVIGMGGFGITYIGWDLNLQTYIAIKEYYPESFAQRDAMTTTIVSTLDSKKEIYDKGLKRYVEEARNLSKFYQLQGIVSVKDFFYENGTGYIVMEYINGVDLKHYLKGMGGKLDEATVLALMKPVFESLYEVHKNGLVHRDISPDNIMVDNEGKIKLIDFGSVRGQSAETDKTYTVILKHGYAPPEQYYAKGKQGPWTDIYSLCATMYKMLTGEVLQVVLQRHALVGQQRCERIFPAVIGLQEAGNVVAGQIDALAAGQVIRRLARTGSGGEGPALADIRRFVGRLPPGVKAGGVDQIQHGGLAGCLLQQTVDQAVCLLTDPAVQVGDQTAVERETMTFHQLSQREWCTIGGLL